MTGVPTENPPAQEPAGQEGAHEQAEDIARLLFVIAHQSMAQFEAVAAEFGLGHKLAQALLGLAQPAPMSALASEMACDASNVTGIADRLEERGLVERRPDEQDRRVKLLVLTPAGGSLRSELAARVGETAPVMTQLSASERETLHALLAKIAGPDAGLPPTGG